MQHKNFLFHFQNFDMVLLDSTPENFSIIWQMKWDWISLIKFETVHILVCCHPEILLPCQHDITTSLYFSLLATKFSGHYIVIIKNIEYKFKWMNGEGTEGKERNQWLRIESWHLCFKKINNHSGKKMWQLRVSHQLTDLSCENESLNSSAYQVLLTIILTTE